MSTLVARRMVTAALALLSIAGYADPTDSVQTSNTLRIELIAQPRELEIPSRFNVGLRLLNSSPDAFTLTKFELRPLEEPGGLRILDDCAKQAQTYIAASTGVTIMCSINSEGFDDSFTGFGRALFGSWSLLTLQPGEYRFVATAVARGDSLFSVNSVVLVKIRPTVWQVCAGAVFGALLLVVFAFSSPKIRLVMNLKERLEGKSKFRRWVGEPFLLWLGACVSASMFIFMTYRLKDVSGPLTVSVNDFYGGVVIGLFGVFLADWLASKLFVAK